VGRESPVRQCERGQPDRYAACGSHIAGR
jgi:hypothetical protein